MKEYLHILKNSNIFMGINENEIDVLLKCLSARTVNYNKKEYILRAGEQVHSIGLVLSGLALIEKDDLWGNCSVISELTPGMVFAESYACLSQIPVETSVIATENTCIMFLDISKILNVCTSACYFHTRLIHNLLNILAGKNVRLTKKIDYLSKKTIKDRLLAYLSTESLKAGSPSFEIPFNRQQLADYLSVDRSALSNEISKLQADGILSCSRNKFILYLFN